MSKCQYCQKNTKKKFCSQQCKIDYHNTRRKFYRKIAALKHLIIEVQELGAILPAKEYFEAAQHPHDPEPVIIYQCYGCRYTLTEPPPPEATH